MDCEPVTSEECKDLYPHCPDDFYELVSCFRNRKHAEKLLCLCDYDMKLAREVSTLVHGNYCLVEKLCDLFEKDFIEVRRFLNCFRVPKDSAYGQAAQFLAKFSYNVRAATAYLARFNNEGAKAIQAIKTVMAMFADEASFKNVLNGCNGDVLAVESFAKFSGIKKLELLYDTEKHNRDTQTFHNLCDQQGPTVTFYASIRGCVCGVTNVSWFSVGNEKWVPDPTAYLCRLAPNPEKYPIKPDEVNYALKIHTRNGPMFGDNIKMEFNDAFPKGIYGWFCEKGTYGLSADPFLFPVINLSYPLERILICRIAK